MINIIKKRKVPNFPAILLPMIYLFGTLFLSVEAGAQKASTAPSFKWSTAVKTKSTVS